MYTSGPLLRRWAGRLFGGMLRVGLQRCMWRQAWVCSLCGSFRFGLRVEVCRFKPDAQVWTWRMAIMPANLHGRFGELECLSVFVPCWLCHFCFTCMAHMLIESVLRGIELCEQL